MLHSSPKNLNYAFLSAEKDNSLACIFIAVVAAHLGLLLFAYLNIGNPGVITPPIKRFVVQTIPLNESKKKFQQDLIALQDPPPIEVIKPVDAIKAEPQVKEEPKAETFPNKEEAPQEISMEAETQKPVEKPVIEEKPKVEEKPVEQKPKPASPQKKKAPQPVKKSEAKKPPPKKPEPAKPKKAPENKPKPAQAKAQPKKAPPKPDPAVEAANAKRRDHLDQAQKNIAKIAERRDKITANKSASTTIANVPGKIESLQIDALIGDSKETYTKQEVGYHEELASRLKLLMRLPDYGEVKVKLTLERSGKFVDVNIVHAESSANRKYVEKTLPKLSYPGFGSNFGDERQHTFSIILSNDV